MIAAHGYAALAAKSPLGSFRFERREPREHDVVIDIEYCGVCHSDIHQARDEWGGSIFPMVPGHEIVGRVARVGSKVKKYKAGDAVGVGCLVDSCRTCESCEEGHEQFCERGFVGTYNSREKDGSLTYGGYSNVIVVNEDFVVRVPKGMDMARAAPLLCAGITTYSPLRHWGIEDGDKVGVVGLGGLGHMAVKLAHAMGAHVVVFTTSSSKAEDARRLGADEVVVSKDAEAMKKRQGTLDFIVNTVSAPHDLNAYLSCLKRDGNMVLVGLPEVPPTINPALLIMQRRSLAGSLIGGIEETQEMLDFCGEHGIVSDVEVIKMDQINDAYERMIKGDVKYRFVIDIKKSN